MTTSLSSLVDNLSEINNKDCKKCMERKSECEFIGLKDNRLKYKCKECDDISAKSIESFQEHINFVMVPLIAGKDLIKHHYHPKNLFIVN